jgi:hypothetical protein
MMTHVYCLVFIVRWLWGGENMLQVKRIIAESMFQHTR